MSVGEFTTTVEIGMISDSDGYGFPSKYGRMDRQTVVTPSKLHLIPPDASHIVWFNC